MDTVATIKAIEERAANAVPASTIQIVEGWRLRASPTVRPRRSNSVLIDHLGETASIDDKIVVAESFYRARGLPTRFQVTSICGHLDQILADRGYAKEGPTFVQTAAIHDLVDQTPSAHDFDIHLGARQTVDWVDTWARAFGLRDAAEQRDEILTRIGPPTIYALASEHGEPVGVAMGVVERGWVGLFNCGTVPHRRRLKVATRLVTALASRAAAKGAEHVYLQVEEENVGALAFYGVLGFATLYSYHYRSKV